MPATSPYRRLALGSISSRTSTAAPRPAPPLPGAPPLRPETVGRERLVRSFGAATIRPLTLVRAPAGFGKTTAVVQWLGVTRRPHAWLSLDPRDDDPRRLLDRLLAAVERPLPGRFEEAAKGLGGGADLEATVIPSIAQALGGPAGAGLAIVIDDYHEVSEPACHRLVGSLVDSLPATASLVLVSRATPPLRLGRRRADGTVAEIGPAELRFEPREAGRLLNGAFDLGLDADDMARIDERLGGWAAGLALVAEAIDGAADRAGLQGALARSRESLRTYLREEVLERLPPEMAAFLRRASILGELSAPLCEAVTGEPHARELLAEARRSSLFVVPLDRDGDSCRFHEVFAAMLRAELRQREPQAVADLHRRAARWHEAAGSPVEAIEHAAAAGDGVGAARILASAWMELVAERRHATLRRLLHLLPEERGEFAPLCAALEVLCMVFDGVDQRITAERARDLLTAHGEDPDVRLVADGILITPFYGEVSAAAELGREAWTRYAEAPAIRERLATQIALVVWFAGRHEEVRELLEPRVSLDQPTTEKVWTLGILAGTEAEEGNAGLAERLAREAEALVRAAGAETATEFAGLPWMMARVLRAAGKPAEAREHMDRGIANEERRPGSVGHAVALIFDAELSLDEGDRTRAGDAARRAREIIERYADLGALPARLAAVEAALGPADDNELLDTEPTAAELRVLELLDSPRSLAEIGAELYLSRETVKSHTRRLYRRLGVGNRSQAVTAARRRGLLRPA